MNYDDDADSYHEATEGKGIRDDNRTATGTIKSYRKTPFSSRYASKATVTEADTNRGGTIYENPNDAPADEHRLLLHDLFARLVTDPQMGLTWPQARANLELFGPNEIMTAQEVPEWLRMCKNLIGGSSSVLIIGVLLAFANYSIEVGKHEDPPLENLFLAVALIIVILITGILSYVQESKTASMARQYEQLVPQTARVIREGEETELPAEELDLGDIIVVRYGEKIPADCRILESNNFMVDNANLTGESEPQERDIQCTNDSQLLSKNMAFYSTYAIQGSARAVVTRTGMNTIMGQMTRLTDENPKAETLITRELSQFLHLITGISIYLGMVFFIIAFLLGYYWIDAILFLIGTIVACVPEGLLAVVTIALSLSAQRLSRRNCVVKNLECVETLGATSVILCDKTGTLTKNQATVAHVWFDNQIGEVDTATERNPEVSFDLNSPSWKNMARIAVLCNRAEFASDSSVIGTPIEAALLRNIETLEGHSGTFRNLHPTVCEIPFNPIIKFQLSIHECQDFQTGGYLLTMMGDPETILKRCTTALVNGEERRIGDDYTAAFRYACTELGGLGERLIALCDWRLPPQKFPPGFAFDTNNINFPLSGFRLVGIMSMMDPPRASVPDSIAKCQAAGIKVIMTTGDHGSTAKAIAKSVGILSLDHDPVERTALNQTTPAALVNGEELDELNTEEIDSILMHYQELIFCNCSAEHKMLLVESCQRLGAVVAVTGDGVNDAAALRKADVGIAMGINGTDIAKDSADMILLDDNFASIVIGIEEGRIMFDNLKKILFYTLASNMAEIAPFALFLIAQIPLPLGALAILCIDLGTDLLPAISLAYEEEEVAYEVMKRGPRNPLRDGLLDERLLFVSCGQLGLIQAAGGFFTYFVIMAENGFWPSRLLGLRMYWDSKAINDLKDSYDQEWTYENRKALEYSCHAGFFFAIVLMQWFTLIASRTRKLSVFQKGMGNWVLNFAIIFETLVAIILIYIPGLNQGLQLEMVNPLTWLASLPFMLLIFTYDEIRKAIVRKHPGGWMEKETCF